jgi:hypothetical protein
MEDCAAKLKTALEDKVPHVVDCDSPTVLFNLCEKDGVRYLFVINDKRTYGDRVGQYKAMMEKSVPQQVEVTYTGGQTGPLVAYDLLDRKALEITQKDGAAKFSVDLTELGGKIIALYPTALKKVALQLPGTVHLAETANVKIGIEDDKGAPVPGLQPLRVDVLDPDGNVQEDSDYVCATHGAAELAFTPAWNAKPGTWKVRVQDLTAGLTAEQDFKVDTAPAP